MKKIFLFFSLLVILATLFSCSRVLSVYNWRFSLEKPEPSETAKLSPETLSYSDDSIDITFVLGGVTEMVQDDIIGIYASKDVEQIAFDIQNKTDRGIKINWDDISIIYPDGTTSRVIHSGVKLIDKSNPQALTIVPPNARVNDILAPTDKITSTSAGWQTAPLFGGNDRLFWNDKEFGVFFPLEIKGEKKEYTFKFKINVLKSTPTPAKKK